MDKARRDCSIRLFIALLINLAMLKPVVDDLNFNGSDLINGLQWEMAFIGGATAAVALVLVARVFRRGTSWQQVGAVLLTPLPIILLFDGLRYWLRGY